MSFFRRVIQAFPKSTAGGGVLERNGRSFSRLQALLLEEDKSDSSQKKQDQNKRRDRIEVDVERERRLDLGPKSQAEYDESGMLHHDRHANKHVLGRKRGDDKNIPYNEKGLDLGDTYGRDYDVEKSGKSGQEAARTGSSQSPDAGRSTADTIRGQEPLKRSGFGYSRDFEGKIDQTGQTSGTSTGSFGTSNNAYPSGFSEQSKENYQDSKKDLSAGVREMKSSESAGGKGYTKDVNREKTNVKK